MKHASDRHDALCAWLTANGANVGAVPVCADIYIVTGDDGQRAIEYEAFVLDADGNKTLDERMHSAAIETRTVPLTVEPPDWWTPHIKPTRDQLLDAVAAVSKLHACNANTGACEHCSARDYPNYEVPWPCPTMQAIGTARTQPPIPDILQAATWAQTATGGSLTYDGTLTREEANALRQAAQDYLNAGGDPRLLGTAPEETA